jgi:hypothetical protein
MFIYYKQKFVTAKLITICLHLCTWTTGTFKCTTGILSLCRISDSRHFYKYVTQSGGKNSFMWNLRCVHDILYQFWQYAMVHTSPACLSPFLRINVMCSRKMVTYQSSGILFIPYFVKAEQLVQKLKRGFWHEYRPPFFPHKKSTDLYHQTKFCIFS